MKKTMMKWGLATSVMVLATTMVPAMDSQNPVAGLFSAQQVEASSVTTYSTTANLNLRASASTKGKKIVTIPKGKNVTYVSKSGSWFKVKYGTKTGWVSSSYIKKTTAKPAVKPVSQSTKTTYTTTSNLNMRAGASTKHKVLVNIPKGKAVTYVSKSGSWFKVKYGTKTGFVSSAYIKKTTVTVKPAPKPPVKAPTKPPVKAPAPPKAPVTPTSPAVKPVKQYSTTALLNMRSGGSTGYKVLVAIPKGKVVNFTGVKASSGWYQVTYGGKTGYVSPSYLKLVIPKTYKTTKYPITLNEMVKLQFSLNGQTDAYKSASTFIKKSSVELKKPTDKTGILKVDSPVVDGATTHTFGTLKAKTKVTIIGETKLYYKVNYQAWRNAKAADITPNVDPKRFAKGTREYYQFLDLSESANVSATELNKVVKGKGILNGKGKAFLDASKAHGVNEVYLVSHALLETGHGSSLLSNGITVSEVDGVKVPPKKVYNMFGIGAIDVSAIKSGSERAYKEGWTTPEKAIMGGAKYIGEAYVNNPEFKQNTLYKMRWNPETPGEHQYATDIGWAVKQTKSIEALYQSLSDYSLSFDVPAYK